MLLHNGDIVEIGAPENVAHRYLQLNFETAGAPGEDNAEPAPADVRLVDAWLQGADGERTASVEVHAPLEFHAIVEATTDVSGPSFGFMLTNADGVDICGFGRALEEAYEDGDSLAAGERIHITANIDNRLAVGRYYISCRAYAEHSYGKLLLVVPQVINFLVFGIDHTVGVVSIFPETSVVRLPRV
jgi:hypothetical protein